MRSPRHGLGPGNAGSSSRGPQTGYARRAMASTATRATLVLRRHGVPFTTHEVESSIAPGDADSRAAGSYGEAVARALGIDPTRMFKTLVVAVDGRLVSALVPVAASLDLRALAAACGARRASLAEPREAERATGYVVGGISPIGQRRRLPVVADRSLVEGPTVYVNGGRRGLQIGLASEELVAVTGAILAPIARREHAPEAPGGEPPEP